MGVSNEKSYTLGKNNLRALIKKKKYTSIDSFCGPGGMSLGLKSAGYELVFAFDNNARAIVLNGTNLALIKYDILFKFNVETNILAFIWNIYYFRNAHLSIHMNSDLKSIAD